MTSTNQESTSHDSRAAAAVNGPSRRKRRVLTRIPSASPSTATTGQRGNTTTTTTTNAQPPHRPRPNSSTAASRRTQQSSSSQQNPLSQFSRLNRVSRPNRLKRTPRPRVAESPVHGADDSHAAPQTHVPPSSPSSHSTQQAPSSSHKNRKRRSRSHLPATFSQEWIDKKQRILRKRAKREYNKKLALIVIRHWKHKAQDRIFALRARRFHQNSLLRHFFIQWRSNVFGKDHVFTPNAGISLFDSQQHVDFGNMRRHHSGAEGALVHPNRRYSTTPPTTTATPLPPASRAVTPIHTPAHQQPPSDRHHQSTNALWQQQFIVSTRHDFLLKQAFFLKWKKKALHQQLQRKNEQRKFSLASNHYLTYLKAFAFRRWQLYIQHIHQKQKNNEKAYVFLYTTSLRKAFNGWKRYIRLKEEYRQLKTIADDFYYTRLLKDVFGHFRFVLHNLELYRQNLDRANQFHSFCLKKHSLQAFRHLLWLKERRIRDAKQIEEFREASIPRYYFRAWRAALHRVRDSRERYKQAVATDFYETHLLKRSIHMWHRYKNHRIEQKRLKAQADEFWLHNHGPRILHTLQEKAQQMREIRELQHAADDFHHLILKRKAMDRLRESLAMCEKNRRDEHTADDFRKQSLLKCMFMHWIERINDIIETENELENAREYYEVRLQFKVVQLWKEYVDVRYQHREDKRLADEHYTQTIQRRQFNQWKFRLEQCQLEHQKWNRAIEHRHLHIMRLCWVYWQQYIEYRRAKKQIIEKTVRDAQQRLDEAKRARIFRAWCAWYRQCVEERVKEMRATNFMRQQLFSRVVKTWKDFVFTKQLHRANKNLAHQHYERKLMKNAMLTLHNRLETAREQHQRNAEATDYYHYNLLKRALASWQNYIKERKEYQRAKEEALAMRQRFLKKFALRRAATATREHREERLPFLRNPEIPRTTLETYELMVKCFRRWRLQLMQKQRYPSWHAPRRGKPKVSAAFQEEKRLEFSKEIEKINPSAAVDDLLVNPLVERPRPRLPTTLLMDTVREDQTHKSKQLLSGSTRAQGMDRYRFERNNAEDDSLLKRYGISTLSAAKENVPPPEEGANRTQDALKQHSSAHYNMESQPPANSDPHNDISLADLQDHTIQYPSFISEGMSSMRPREAPRVHFSDTSNHPEQAQENTHPIQSQTDTAAETKARQYDQLQQQITQIQDALARILPLKEQYSQDQAKLEQLRKEMEEFPFDKEQSKEYANMQTKEKVLLQRINRFKQMRETKLPQLQQVLATKIGKLREMAAQ